MLCYVLGYVYVIISFKFRPASVCSPNHGSKMGRVCNTVCNQMLRTVHFSYVSPERRVRHLLSASGAQPRSLALVAKRVAATLAKASNIVVDGQSRTP